MKNLPHTPWLPLPRYQGVSGAGMYGDFTAQVDDLVGDVVSALARLGYSDNALLIVTSDNGPVWYPKDVERFGHRASHRYGGMKFDFWEEGHRMPFIARWPAHVPSGSVSDAPIVFTDLLPAFASLAGSELLVHAGEDGESFLPDLLGTASERTGERTLVHFRSVDRFAIPEGPWKLISGEPEGELYYLPDDVAETRNLYLERPDVVRRLAALLETYGPTNHQSPE